MPLLSLEPNLFPEDLLSESVRTRETVGGWWVLHTRPRAEKALARKCLDRRLPFFLPLYRRQWTSRGRLLASHLPLFPGYVFLHGDGEARLVALQTNLVAQVLPVPNQARLWEDLIRVHRLIASGLPVAPEPDLAPGTPVEIMRGPLAGLQGKILRQGKQWKFLVEVQFLQQAVVAEIDGWMIQRPSGQPAAPLGNAS